MAGDWSSDCTWHGLGLRWLPVPAGGDLARGPGGTCGTDCPTAMSKSCCHCRAVREQPDRGRPRTAESPAPAHARPEASPLCADSSRRSCLRAESAPRPLRDRHRSPRPSQASNGIRRPHARHLKPSRTSGSCRRCPKKTQRNSAPRRAACHGGRPRPRPSRTNRRPPPTPDGQGRCLAGTAAALVGAAAASWALIRAVAAGEAAPVHQESAAYCAGGGTGVAVILI